MWQYLAALLMSLSHDPQAGNAEPPRAAAAVAAAYAGLCVDISPPLPRHPPPAAVVVPAKALDRFGCLMGIWSIAPARWAASAMLSKAHPTRCPRLLHHPACGLGGDGGRRVGRV